MVMTSLGIGSGMGKRTLIWSKWKYFPLLQPPSWALGCSITQCWGCEFRHWIPWVQIQLLCILGLMDGHTYLLGLIVLVLYIPIPTEVHFQLSLLCSISKRLRFMDCITWLLDPLISMGLSQRQVERKGQEVRIFITSQYVHPFHTHWDLNFGGGCCLFPPQLL